MIRKLGKALNRFISSLQIPFNPADIETNRANITSALVNLGILIISLYLIPGIIDRGLFSPQIITTIAVLLMFIGFSIGIRKGYSNRVASILLILVWLFIECLFLFYENGLRAPAYSAAIGFLIVFAGIMHGRRGAVLVTAFSLATSFGVILLERGGITFTEARIPDIYWSAFGQLLFFSASAFLVNRNHSNLEKTIEMYQQQVEERIMAEDEIRNLNKELILAYDTTLEGWARALELRDKETEGHSRRVTELTWQLARRLGFSQIDLVWIRHGALLHDIGKMGIPDEILHKHGELTTAEREVINRHPMIAYNLLKDIRYLQKSLEIPLYHHERWDGTGYPKGLKGEEIPLSARIFAVVDVWDALNHDRPYRKAWTRQDAEEYIISRAGSQFDPQVVQVFFEEVLDQDGHFDGHLG